MAEITITADDDIVEKAEKECAKHGIALTDCLSGRIDDQEYEAENQTDTHEETPAERLKREERTRDGYLLAGCQSTWQAADRG